MKNHWAKPKIEILVDEMCGGIVIDVFINDVIVERWEDLNKDKSDKNWLENVINTNSKYIKVEDLSEWLPFSCICEIKKGIKCPVYYYDPSAKKCCPNFLVWRKSDEELLG